MVDRVVVVVVVGLVRGPLRGQGPGPLGRQPLEQGLARQGGPPHHRQLAVVALAVRRVALAAPLRSRPVAHDAPGVHYPLQPLLQAEGHWLVAQRHLDPRR